MSLQIVIFTVVCLSVRRSVSLYLFFSALPSPLPAEVLDSPESGNRNLACWHSGEGEDLGHVENLGIRPNYRIPTRNEQTEGVHSAQQKSNTTTTETRVVYGNSTWHASKYRLHKLSQRHIQIKISTFGGVYILCIYSHAR